MYAAKKEKPSKSRPGVLTVFNTNSALLSVIFAVIIVDFTQLQYIFF